MKELLETIKECTKQCKLLAERRREAERKSKIIGFNYNNQNK